MCQLMDKGEIVQAGRIARAILSNPKWHGFIPANAVMGSVAAYEGDYVASERFFQVATDTTNTVATVVLNNYADTLMNLGKLAEAEKIARRAVKESEETFWLARLTLAEILEKRRVTGAIDERALKPFAVGKNGEKTASDAPAEDSSVPEIKALIKSVLKHAPQSLRERIRKEHKGYTR